MGLDPKNEVPARVTPLSYDQIRQALIEGHQTIRGGEVPNRNRLRFAWCHVCLEVSGGKAAWVYNLGNIKTSERDAWKGAWYKFPPEILEKAPKEWPYQRGYGSAEAGATDYWRLMWAKWSKAISQADTGDLRAAAVALRQGGYYEADATKYGDALVRWSAVYDRRWPDETRGEVLGWIAVGALAVVGAWIWFDSR